MVLRIQYVSLFPPELAPQLEAVHPSVALDVLLLEIKKIIKKNDTHTTQGPENWIRDPVSLYKVVGRDLKLPECFEENTASMFINNEHLYSYSSEIGC